MNETKKFPLRVVLTCTTERLLTKSQSPLDNGIGELYDLLGWMTKDEPFTHQLPRFNSECKPWLLRWFPELANASEHLDALDGCIRALGGEAGVEKWLAGLSLATEYDVPRIPADYHERKNPFDELVAMRGTDEGIVIVDTPNPKRRCRRTIAPPPTQEPTNDR